MKGRITAAAYNHALMLIKEYYPQLAEEAQIRQATRLAEKICNKEKH